MKKNIPLFQSFNPTTTPGINTPGINAVKTLQMGVPFKLGEFSKDGRSRKEILGEPLSRAEIKALVKPLISDNRQVNLGMFIFFI